MARIVLIDGRSGSGKTTFAVQLARSTGAALLHLEDLYPGWDGLLAGSGAVAPALNTGSYQRYDWGSGAFTEWIALDPSRPLVIEGCGALSRENLAAAHRFARLRGVGPEAGTVPDALIRSIWMECPAELRRARALARDGEMFRPHWERWAAQEAAHFAQHAPVALAAEIVHAELLPPAPVE